MVLKFDNGSYEREIGKPQSDGEAMKIINDFLKIYNYKSYYVRFWEENDVRIYDVGSWSQFFKLYLRED